MNFIDKPYYNVKCAGMPQKCKDLFIKSMYADKINDEEKEELTDDERKFLFDDNDKPIIRTLNDFKIGLKIPGKLMPKRIRGGVLLVDTTYEMR